MDIKVIVSRLDMLIRSLPDGHLRRLLMMELSNLKQAAGIADESDNGRIR